MYMRKKIHLLQKMNELYLVTIKKKDCATNDDG